MRSLLILCALGLGLGACDDDRAPADGGADMGAEMADVCPTACPVCDPGETCVTPDTVGQFGAACLRPCSDDRDCSGGACVQIAGATRYCVDQATPPTCGLKCAIAGRGHCEGDVAVNPSRLNAAACGNRYVFCALGCEATDGGAPTARCR